MSESWVLSFKESRQIYKKLSHTFDLANSASFGVTQLVAIITRTFETAFEILAFLTTLAKYGTLVDIVAIMWVTL